MDVNFGVKLHNRFDAVLTDAKTGEVKQVAKAENVVTDSYWSKAGDSYGQLSVGLGTGTGIPTVTDTNFFNQIGRYNFDTAGTLKAISENQWSSTWTFTLSEDQANTTLTEIGFCQANDYSTGWTSGKMWSGSLYTHAVFTDSEGNPISITKTNSDRLTVTCTGYVTITPTNTNDGIYTTLWHRSLNSASCDPRLPKMSGDTYKTALPNMWLFLCSVISFGLYAGVNTLPCIGSNFAAMSGYSGGHIESDITYNVSRSGNNITTRNQLRNRTLATAGNLNYPSTYIVRSIDNVVAFCTLPNNSVYPTRNLTLEKVGDGTTTDFNFNIPILNITNAKVYINGVLQAPNSYSLNSNNYKHPQGWGSYDTLYLTKYTWVNSTGSSSVTLYNISPVNCIPSRSNYSDNFNQIHEFYYDFKTPYTVSAVGKFIVDSVYSHSTEYPKLYYSNDNENWTLLPTWESRTAYYNFSNIDNSDGWLPVTTTSARYWKVVNPYMAYSNLTTCILSLSASLVFGDPKPQLHFNTAPPADSTITLEAACDYPIKNSNWIVENSMYFDYTFTRQ